MAKSEIVEEKDRNRGIAFALFYAVIGMILLLFLSFTEPDPPYENPPVPIELDQEMIIEDFEVSSAGGGTPSSVKDPKPTPPAKGDPVITSKDPANFTHTTGTGGTKPVNDPKPNNPQPDPLFSFPGGGSGGGSGGGTGGVFGAGSDKEGSGGSGGGGARKVMSPPCPPAVGNEEGDIYLTVWVDEEGRVIKAENISGKSTTSSVSVINAAIKGVTDCMRFDKRPGASVSKFELSGPIKIRRQ